VTSVGWAGASSLFIGKHPLRSVIDSRTSRSVDNFFIGLGLEISDVHYQSLEKLLQVF